MTWIYTNVGRPPPLFQHLYTRIPQPTHPSTHPDPPTTVVVDIPQNYSHPMMPLKDEPMDPKPAQPFLLDARCVRVARLLYVFVVGVGCLYALMYDRPADFASLGTTTHKHQPIHPHHTHNDLRTVQRQRQPGPAHAEPGGREGRAADLPLPLPAHLPPRQVRFGALGFGFCVLWGRLVCVVGNGGWHVCDSVCISGACDGQTARTSPTNPTRPTTTNKTGTPSSLRTACAGATPRCRPCHSSSRGTRTRRCAFVICDCVWMDGCGGWCDGVFMDGFVCGGVVQSRGGLGVVWHAKGWTDHHS